MHRLIGVIPEALKAQETVTFEDIRPTIETQFKLKVDQVNWYSTYRVHHRVAASFGGGRVFIAGDAGHIHSPAGGQGMNTGIGDAVNLSWKLADVIQGRADASLLQSYEPERIAFARALVSTTDKAFQAIVDRNVGGRVFRGFLLPDIVPWALRFTAMQRLMFKLISQIRITYRGSPISIGRAGDVEGGDRLPWVVDGEHDNFEKLASLRWQVHVYGDAEFPLRDVAMRHHLPLHEFRWNEMAQKAGLAKDALYLIRPDGHVGFANAGQDIEALEIYLTAHALKGS